jgi:hypothetical protein
MLSVIIILLIRWVACFPAKHHRSTHSRGVVNTAERGLQLTMTTDVHIDNVMLVTHFTQSTTSRILRKCQASNIFISSGERKWSETTGVPRAEQRQGYNVAKTTERSANCFCFVVISYTPSLVHQFTVGTQHLSLTPPHFCVGNASYQRISIGRGEN